MDVALADAVRIYIDKLVDSFVSHKGPEEDLEDLYDLVMNPIETRLIQMVLRKCGGNKARAAKILGLHRNTLAQKVAAFGLKPNQKHPASGVGRSERRTLRS